MTGFLIYHVILMDLVSRPLLKNAFCRYALSVGLLIYHRLNDAWKKRQNPTSCSLALRYKRTAKLVGTSLETQLQLKADCRKLRSYTRYKLLLNDEHYRNKYIQVLSKRGFVRNCSLTALSVGLQHQHIDFKEHPVYGVMQYAIMSI
jgi:hypothetical protein